VSQLEFCNLLAAGDVDGLRAYWSRMCPHMPQPEDRASAEAMMHLARTASVRIPFRARAYSHAWLCEREIPSQLPDELKPRAERIYPRVTKAVGISVNTQNPYLEPAMVEVRQAMEQAVLEVHADVGLDDSALVQKQMFAAHHRAMRQLFGRR